MTGQRYFQILSSDCGKAEQAVWASDDAAHRQRTHVSSVASGMYASMWTTNPEHQDRLRDALRAQGISFDESAEQQVVAL